MIDLCNVSFSYKKNIEVLKEITYSFKEGNLYLIKGVNGSGKTTLGKLLCGLLRTKTGYININGNDIKKMNVGEISNYIGYLFQNPDMQLFAPTVLEELLFPYELQGLLTEAVIEKADKILEQFNLSDKKNSFPLLMSGGEKQRLALATVMMRQTKFIIFDEPTSSVDTEGRELVVKFVTNYVNNGGGAIIITHDEELEIALKESKLLTMKGGALHEEKV